MGPRLLTLTERNSRDELSLEIGSRLRAMRQSQGKSMQEVSDESGVSKAYICEIEHGQAHVTVAILNKWVEALGWTLGGFFGYLERRLRQ